MMSTISKLRVINKVVAKFVIKTLPIISGETDYESLNEMVQDLYTNTAILPTTMAGRKDGHVFLIMRDTIYAIMATRTP